MESLILIVHVLLALGVVGLVLLQHGKGADAGASFGAGASQTVFGSRGAGNFLTRTTAILATLFFITSFALAIYAKHQAEAQSTIGMPGMPALQEAAPITEVPDMDAARSSAPVQNQATDTAPAGEMPQAQDAAEQSATESELPELGE